MHSCIVHTLLFLMADITSSPALGVDPSSVVLRIHPFRCLSFVARFWLPLYNSQFNSTVASRPPPSTCLSFILQFLGTTLHVPDEDDAIVGVNSRSQFLSVRLPWRTVTAPKRTSGKPPPTDFLYYTTSFAVRSLQQISCTVLLRLL